MKMARALLQGALLAGLLVFVAGATA